MVDEAFQDIALCINLGLTASQRIWFWGWTLYLSVVYADRCSCKGLMFDCDYLKMWMFCKSGLYEFVVFAKPIQLCPIRTLLSDDRQSIEC